MLDIGAMELFVVAVLALVVVGPKELPKLLRTVGGFVRKMREMAAEFRAGVEDLAAEVERNVDPFADLRKEEGLRPGMSPDEVTEHIMAKREKEARDNAGDPPKPAPDTPKKKEHAAKKESNAPKKQPKSQKKQRKPADPVKSPKSGPDEETIS